MKLLLSSLTCIAILACSDESMSEDNIKKDPRMLGIFGEKAKNMLFLPH
jgi:hypothetical protein